MAFQYLEYHIRKRLCYITLNRPDKRNALNGDLVNELKEALKSAEKDPDVKIIILNARGKSFSAGADLEYLKELQQNSYQENLADSNSLKELFYAVYTLKKVVIAQVEGHAIAGGCGLVTVCDLSFAVPEAIFGYTEVKIGFIPAIVMFFLIRKVGEAKAKELLLTGKLIDAKVASDCGLINYVVDKSKIMRAVEEFGLELASTASEHSMAATKEMIGTVQGMNLEKALDFAAIKNAEARGNADCKTGVEAFLNKMEVKW